MVKIKTRIDSSRWSSGTNTYEKKAKCRRSSITTTTNVETGDVTGIERRFIYLTHSTFIKFVAVIQVLILIIYLAYILNQLRMNLSGTCLQIKEIFY